MGEWSKLRWCRKITQNFILGKKSSVLVVRATWAHYFSKKCIFQRYHQRAPQGIKTSNKYGGKDIIVIPNAHILDSILLYIKSVILRVVGFMSTAKKALKIKSIWNIARKQRCF